MAVIEHIYDALFDDAALEALPARLAALVGARSCTLQTVVGGTPVHVASSYFTDEMNAFYLDQDVIALDPWGAGVVQRGWTDRVVSADDFMDRGDFARSAFYNDFFRRFGDDTGVSLGGIFTTRDGFVGLGLHRPLRAAAFGEAERGALAEALPHLRRLAEGRARLRGMEADRRDVEGLLHNQPSPVLLTDVAGRIVFANAAGAALLARCDGLASVQGRLAAPGTGGDRLAAAIAQAAGPAASGDALLIRRASGASPLRVVTAPHRGPGARPGRAVVMIEVPGDPAPGLEATLRRMYGLTASEATLAARLSAGQTLAQASEARGVLPSTSRSQLNAVLAKTGLRRQGELMVLIAGLPRMAG